ncbi:hypothetical protein DdX_12648 [Ditylenchus destructor]|uniref:Uncharacterized protein n=1 Tax=Ditylenchus destructor TaxID=166010 RepID=A0AAD4QX62_9BILA|nr:hypothetical protein DdX_12648 [Ditylenchus destructor]
MTNNFHVVEGLANVDMVKETGTQVKEVRVTGTEINVYVEKSRTWTIESGERIVYERAFDRCCIVIIRDRNFTPSPSDSESGLALGHQLRNGRRPALFAYEMWSVYQRTLDGEGRTNNHAEAAHRRLQTELAHDHPTLYALIEG